MENYKKVRIPNMGGGHLWDGEVNSYGEPSGKGHLIYSQESELAGASYDGYMCVRERSSGTMTWADGTRFKGYWRDDRPSKGRIDYTTEGVFYSGEVNGFIDNKQTSLPLREGVGVYLSKNGDYYKGKWTRGHKVVGCMYYANGNRYEGQWTRSRKQGFGILYYLNGDRYEGYWKDDMRHGKGIYYYGDGSRYIGEWEYDFRTGRGVFCFHDGRIEEGEWKDYEFILNSSK